MADDKPCISELYESGGLDMDLVGKIAHNELDKRKALLPNSDPMHSPRNISISISMSTTPKSSSAIPRYSTPS